MTPHGVSRTCWAKTEYDFPLPVGHNHSAVLPRVPLELALPEASKKAYQGAPENPDVEQFPPGAAPLQRPVANTLGVAEQNGPRLSQVLLTECLSLVGVTLANENQSGLLRQLERPEPGRFFPAKDSAEMAQPDEQAGFELRQQVRLPKLVEQTDIRQSQGRRLSCKQFRDKNDTTSSPR